MAAIAHLTACFELRELWDTPASLAAVYHYLGVANVQMNDHGRGLEHLREALRIRREQGLDDSAAATQLFLSEVYVVLGDLERAEALLSVVESHWKSAGATHKVVLCVIRHARLALANGSPEVALERIDEISEHLEGSSDIYTTIDSLLVTARAARMIGNLERQESAAEFALALCEEHGKDIGMLPVLDELWHVAFAREDYARAEEIISRAESLELGERNLLDRVQVLDARATIAERLGDTETALGMMKLARELEREHYAQQAEQNLHYHRAMLDLDDVRTAAEHAHRENEALRRLNQDLEAANSRLWEVNSELQEVLGVAAHDLRSPLSGIIAEAKLAMMSLPSLSEDELTEHFDNIQDAGQRLDRSLNEMLQSHEVEAGRRTLRRVECDVHETLSAVLNHVRAHARRKHIVVDARREAPDEAPIEVWADPLGLVEILDNLVSNAVTFSSPRSVVRISVQRLEEHVAISVMDHGPGLSEDDQALLFRKFQRLTPRPTADEHSTGLGLYISAKLAEQMDGHLECASKLGEGSRFTVVLPSAAREP